MELLKLDKNQEPQKINWKKERVSYWCYIYEQRVGRRDPLGYPALMRLLSLHCEEHWSYADEETGGEIQFEIPPIDEWKEQVDGFFNDEFNKQIKKYFFPRFLKNYGSFKPIIVKKFVPVIRKSTVMLMCPDCSKPMTESGCKDVNCPSNKR